MFDKEKFGAIIKRINDSSPTQHEFADYSGVNRTYLSQYINMKLDVPPKPKILEKIASASKGITTYDELMQICGYTNYMADFFFNDAVHQQNNRIPVVYDINYNKEKNTYVVDSDSNYIVANFKLEKNKEYFAYKVKDDAMLPLLGTGDLAIIEKTDKYKNGRTYLIEIDNKYIIRKILIFDDYIELHNSLSYGQPIKIFTKDLESKSFHILGEVIKAEINFK